MDLLQETIMRYIPSNHRSSGKCITINCPCCVMMGESRNDTKGRGGLFLENSETGYNCFNCGFKFRQSGNKPLSRKAKQFLHELNVPKEEINRILFYFKKNEQTTPLDHLLTSKTKDKPKNLDLNFVDGDLPPDTQLLHDILGTVDQDHPAFKVYEYAYDRGIHNYPYLMWSSSTTKNMTEYLIIPFIYKSRILGYQARYAGSNPWYEKNHRLFINSNPNTGKYLFGIDNIFSDQKILIINESAIDSITYKGVGLMSHSISQKQIDIINSFKGKKILVPDFGKGGVDMAHTAMKNDWYVYDQKIGLGSDLGQLTQKFGRFFMLNDIIANSTNQPLKIKIIQGKL